MMTMFMSNGLDVTVRAVFWSCVIHSTFTRDNECNAMMKNDFNLLELMMRLVCLSAMISPPFHANESRGICRAKIADITPLLAAAPSQKKSRTSMRPL